MADASQAYDKTYELHSFRSQPISRRVAVGENENSRPPGPAVLPVLLFGSG
jgi:hypothetical protein